MIDTSLPRNGRIITFYSYKGGTGRSMTLANVAWILANSGKRVLTVDWDLEAPGLHRYFYPFLADKDLNFSEGIIDFVHFYRSMAMTPPSTDEEASPEWYVKYADIRPYAVKLNWKFPEGGQIDFVPSGRQDDTYSTLVNSFSWEDFYTRLGGGRFLEAVTRFMREHYDYVLIDSRTGVSDTSGICTVKMPDALVVCFTLNYQSINGASAVANYVNEKRRADASAAEDKRSKPDTDGSPDGRPMFNIFPVPMRLENAQKRKMERRSEYARLRKFAQYPIHLYEGTREDYWAKVPLPYDSYYAYEEILAAFGEKERYISSLLASVERLTAYLTDGAVTGLATLPQPEREGILRQFEGDTYEPSSDEAVGNMAAETAFANLTAEQRESARQIILRLVRVAGPGEVEHTRQFAGLEEFDPASQAIIHTLRNFQLLTVEPDKERNEEVVQISPDVSLRDWNDLRDWIDSDRDFLLWRQELRAQAEKWRRGRKAKDLLPGDAPLSIARMRMRDRTSELGKLERDYIEAGIALQERKRLEQSTAELESYERKQREQLEFRSQRRELYERERQSGWLKNLVERFTPANPPPAEFPDESPKISRAKQVLRGTELPAEEMLALAKGLKSEKAFSYARRVLALARGQSTLKQDKDLQLKIHQESALCTYKDPDLPMDERLDLALDLLREVEDLSSTRNQETLGLVGAIFKRKWEFDGQKQQLERSLLYYRRGYQEGTANDQGYTGINTAFVLDLLAHLEAGEAEQARVTSDTAERRRLEARRIREDIVQSVAPLVDRSDYDWLAGMWWFYATVAEAFFGLRQYKDAVYWMKRGREAVGTVQEWEYESMIRQLVRLAMLQSGPGISGEEFERTEAWQALVHFFGDDAAVVRTAFLGKIGLALSGGGFRASLFHVGVLAKLAELDLLRHMEVLSCVSGGSIVGAHYYLEVRRLLQSKSDREISRQDYIDLVTRIKEDFLEGVQRNIRTRIAAEFITNLAVMLRPRYSRTKRAGELYEREIFSRVDDGEGNKPRWLNHLNINPVGEPEHFSPKLHNWRRAAKVPILVLNATTLNTGHNWQFTTTWMGEPPASIVGKIDGNDRLRRMYYREAPEKYRHVRLGHAVAASACVPGIFEPLVFEDLYPDRDVRLVDGGVCDNQGISSLLEQDCTVMLVSDASGQMESQKAPSSGLLGVLTRSNTIFQSRLREAQYRELAARWRSSLLRGFMFMHLKEDLEADPIDWVNCLDPYQASDDARPPARKGVLTRYGIAKDLQKSLAATRTDLDSFSDVEAYSLMTSAYRMTEYACQNSQNLTPLAGRADQAAWDFLMVEQGMKGTGKKYTYLKQHLSVSSSRAFKVWKQSPSLKVVAAIPLILLLALILYGTANKEIFVPAMAFIRVDFRQVMITVAVIMAALAFSVFFAKVIVGKARWSDISGDILIGTGMLLIGWIAARVHLCIFDRMFLKRGSIEHFQRQGDS